MLEVFEASQSYILIFYAGFLLYVNISYLLEYRKLRKALENLDSEEDLEIRPDSFGLVLFALAFEFFRSWLFYIIVFKLTGNVLVIVLLVVFIVMDSYHAMFNTAFKRIRQSRIGVTRSIADTLFISIFVVYYVMSSGVVL